MEYRNKPLMQFPGSQQTCYADWARSVLIHYPNNPKFQRVAEQVWVFYNNDKVAEFDFETGTGTLAQNGHFQGDQPTEVGRLPNFEVFNIDTLLQK